MSRRAVAFLVLLSLLCCPALAEKRVALLIGNEAYSSEIGRLANPHNDVALLEKSLKGLGFEVTIERDVGLGAMTRAVNAYARRLSAAGPNTVGFLYYSGHGAADGSTNYLIPIDVKTTETGELWDQSLRLTEITRKLKAEAGNATHFVVFDACRNTLKLTKTGSRAVVQSKGFVPVSQESGMLIAYATAEGELASDVGAGAGPYAEVLAEEIVKPGVEAVYMFRRVQVRVRSTIGQEPWLGFSALPEVHFAGAQASEPTRSASASQLSEAGQTWAAIKDTTNQSVLEAFAKQFADTVYGALARARLEELKRSTPTPSQPPAASDPTPPRTSAGAEAAWFRLKNTDDIEALEAFRRQYAGYDRLVEARIEELKKQQASTATPQSIRPAPPASNTGDTKPAIAAGPTATRPGVAPSSDPTRPAIAASPRPRDPNDFGNVSPLGCQSARASSEVLVFEAGRNAGFAALRIKAWGHDFVIDEVIVSYAADRRPTSYAKQMFIKMSAGSPAIMLEDASQSISRIALAYTAKEGRYPPQNPSLCVEGLK